MLLVMLIVATISIAENSRTHEGLLPCSARQRVVIGQEALDLIFESWIPIKICSYTCTFYSGSPLANFPSFALFSNDFSFKFWMYIKFCDTNLSFPKTYNLLKWIFCENVIHLWCFNRIWKILDNFNLCRCLSNIITESNIKM
jgi:hypothetical protein